jgi:hypothetical protein
MVMDGPAMTRSDRPARGAGRRTRWLLVFLGVFVLLGIWLVLVGTKALVAYNDDRQGLDLLNQVRSAQATDVVSGTAVRSTLRSAAGYFNSAAKELSSPLFIPVSVLPVVGRQYESARDLSAAAHSVSVDGEAFLGDVHGLLESARMAGSGRVNSLRQLGVASQQTADQLSRIPTGPSDHLVPRLADKRNQFVDELNLIVDRLNRTASASASAATLLQGPSRILILVANNAEMRAGSGSFLEVGTASVSEGHIHLDGLQPSGNIPVTPGLVNPTGDLAANWGFLHPGVDWRNLGLTPQFDVNAAMAERMWRAETGQSVDGVIAIDVAGLAQLMTVTGPVEVNGMTLTAGNVTQYLEHDEYANLSDYSAVATNRVSVLGDLASSVLGALQDQSIPLRPLASAVTTAVAGRHIMIWSGRPSTEASWVATGAGGVLTSNSLAVGLINRGGNKLDQYVPVSVGLISRAEGTGAQVTLSVHVTNHTPDGQSSYIAGPSPGVPVAYGGYLGYLSVNVPGFATHLTSTGPVVVRGSEGPTGLVATTVNVPQGGSSSFTIRFHLPTRHGVMVVVPSARIPPVTWTHGGNSFVDDHYQVIGW